MKRGGKWPLAARAGQAGKPPKLRVMLIPDAALCALKQKAAGAH